MPKTYIKVDPDKALRQGPSTAWIRFPARVWKRGLDGLWYSRPAKKHDLKRRVETAEALKATLIIQAGYGQ